MLLHRMKSGGSCQYPRPHAAVGNSDVEEDSWSEPDVNAARRRMGLAAVSSAQDPGNRSSRKGAEDSSETDLDKREYSICIVHIVFGFRL